MSVTYEDLQSLENEEKSQRFMFGPRSLQSLLQRLWSGVHLHLLSLGLSLLLLVIICVIGSQSDSLQQTTRSLRAEMDIHKKELQTATSLHGKVLTLEKKLKEQEESLKAGHLNMLFPVQQLAKDLKFLSCQMAALKSNSSQNTCCLADWVEHGGSCYWFSSSARVWSEAEDYCQLRGAHLVVINSLEEQNFVQDFTASVEFWIGLSDPEGVWKWADGTDYETNFQNWEVHQPDNWEGHGLGGGEDCVHFQENGKWNDNACKRSFLWLCESSLGKTT